jgi:hypothetical protein
MLDESNNKPKNLKNLLSDNKFKQETVNSINYLCNICFIDEEYHNDSLLNNKKNNKILSDKLNQIIYDYDNLKLPKNINCRHIQIKETQEESINHYKNIVEKNTTIFDFMNNN